MYNNYKESEREMVISIANVLAGSYEGRINIEKPYGFIFQLRGFGLFDFFYQLKLFNTDF